MKAKAVVLQKFNTLEGIQIADLELEDLAIDMVEVKVQYCGVNFADFYTIHQLAGRQVPLVLGIECSGVVTQVGGAAVPFKVGDRVVCYDHRGGLHRSSVRVKHEKCFALPDYIDLATGAAVFVNYLTAWYSLFSVGSLKDGDSVFVSSCAGGVGLAVVELVKSRRNVTIYGTASPAKRAFLESKGIQFIEYGQASGIKERFDLVIESTSSETRAALMEKLKPFGKLVIIGAKDLIGGASTADPDVSPLKLIFGNAVIGGLHIGVLADDHPALVRETLHLIWRQIDPRSVRSTTYAFEDARHAYEEVASRKNIGKILLKL